jgi:hypothetical protein
LSNRELVTHISMTMHNEDGMPLAYQIELLRRFNYYIAISSQESVLGNDTANPQDPKQLDLFN